MSADLSFEEYLENLSLLTPHVDPTLLTKESAAILGSAHELDELPQISQETLIEWLSADPRRTPILGLAVGLTQERLKNVLHGRFETAGWVNLARSRADEVIQWMDKEFDLVALVELQRGRTYHFGDVLVARAGSRVRAASAARSGRGVEDEIEAVAERLGLDYDTRTRFTGRNGRDAPCDLVIRNIQGDTAVVVAAKGFDSTGSKLTDSVREIEEMAEVRLPRQMVIAVIDGIGWNSRKSDLRKIHSLWETDMIDGMYTLATLGDFENLLAEAIPILRLR